MKTPETEFSDEFVTAMRNRMMVSYYKYGPVAEGFPDRINALRSLQQRIDKYTETGNTEYLVDAANFAMIEFMHPSHADAHFRATDSDGSPGRITRAYDHASHTKNRDAIPVDLPQE